MWREPWGTRYGPLGMSSLQFPDLLTKYTVFIDRCCRPWLACCSSCCEKKFASCATNTLSGGDFKIVGNTVWVFLVFRFCVLFCFGVFFWLCVALLVFVGGEGKLVRVQFDCGLKSTKTSFLFVCSIFITDIHHVVQIA